MADFDRNRRYKLCAKCSKPAALFCSKCRVTPYCTPTCQTSHWKLHHKQFCHPNEPAPPSTKLIQTKAPNQDYDRPYKYIIIKPGAPPEAETNVEVAMQYMEGYNDNRLVIQKWLQGPRSFMMPIPDRAVVCKEFGWATTPDTQPVNGWSPEDAIMLHGFFDDNFKNEPQLKSNRLASYINFGDFDVNGSFLVCKANFSQPLLPQHILSITMREVYELALYRRECRLANAKPDRIHRGNMRGKEQESIFLQQHPGGQIFRL